MARKLTTVTAVTMDFMSFVVSANDKYELPPPAKQGRQTRRKTLETQRLAAVSSIRLVRLWFYCLSSHARTEGAASRQPRPTAWGLGQPTFVCPERATLARVLPFQGAGS